MILVVGPPQDVLCAAVVRRCGRRAVLVDETVLFSDTPFAYESAPGAGWTGFLRAGGRDVSFEDLSGVLLRVALEWSPAPRMDPSDAVFVMHETTAAWFELLAGLDCPVVNRPSLAGWGRDPAFAETVRDDLAARWGIPAGGSPGDTCYVSPRTVHSALRSFDAPRLGALWAWQETWGLDVCSLVLSAGADALVSVDPAPAFRDAPAPFLRRVVDDVVGQFA